MGIIMMARSCTPSPCSGVQGADEQGSRGAREHLCTSAPPHLCTSSLGIVERVSVLLVMVTRNRYSVMNL